MVQMRKYLISAESYQEIVDAEKATKSKRLSKKLSILLIRFGGKTIAETAEQMNCSEAKVKRTVAEYMKSGLKEFMRTKQQGNHRLLSLEKEKEILSRFDEESMNGEIVEIKDIKQAFDKEIGKETRTGYIYEVLKRHGWRKVMPRAKHPKKADDEAIEASKKLMIP